MANNNTLANKLIYGVILIFITGALSWGISTRINEVRLDSVKESIEKIEIKVEKKAEKKDLEKIDGKLTQTRDTVIRMEEQLKNIQKLLEKMNK